jgi:hypothetical protein
MVLTNAPALLYTVTVWRYIMFWANTRPAPDASTDFGEMGPPMVWMSASLLRSVGGPGGTTCEGKIVVVVDGDVAAVVARDPWAAAATF